MDEWRPLVGFIALALFIWLLKTETRKLPQSLSNLYAYPLIRAWRGNVIQMEKWMSAHSGMLDGNWERALDYPEAQRLFSENHRLFKKIIVFRPDLEHDPDFRTVMDKFMYAKKISQK